MSLSPARRMVRVYIFWSKQAAKRRVNPLSILIDNLIRIFELNLSPYPLEVLT